MLFLLAAIMSSKEPAAQPRFASDNQLIRPEGYREWIFIGASLGMGYKQSSGSGSFHNLYLQPEAYRQFVTKGTFPDKTILVMEVLSAASKASINRNGHFEDQFIGVEAAVKDEKRFPEKWAYFDFMGENGQALAQAKPSPKQDCWACHNKHAAVDNVFVQFYPVLRNARPAAQ